MIEIIGIILGLVVITPTLTLAHELGHALPQLLKGYPVKIVLGLGSDVRTLNWGNLSISSTKVPMHVGYSEISSRCSSKERVISLAMGPLTSLGMCTLLYFASKFQLPYLLSYCINFGLYFSLLQTLVTAVPMQYPSIFGAYEGMHSDGKQILEILKR
ncbi:site-2 protease family protein [Vibrio vulnificus]